MHTVRVTQAVQLKRKAFAILDLTRPESGRINKIIQIAEFGLIV